MTTHVPTPASIAAPTPPRIDLRDERAITPPSRPGSSFFAHRRRHGLLVVRVLSDALGFGVPLLLVGGQPFAALVTTALLAAVLGHGGLYRSRLHLSILDEVPALVARAMAVVGTVQVLVAPAPRTARALIGAVAGVVGLVLLRSVLHALVRSARTRGLVRHRTLVLGGGDVAADLVQTLRDHPEYGLQPVGYVDDTPSRSSVSRLLPYLGSARDLGRAVEQVDAAVLLVAFGSSKEADLVQALTAAARARDVFVVPRFYEAFGNKYGDHIGAVPVVRRRRASLRGPSVLVKRAFDIVCSVGALAVLAPVLIACAVAVRWEGGPGVIFRQQRVGKDGHLFELLKFRSLLPVDERESAVHWNIAHDDRVGPVGRVLRKTSLDELPQLWNILRGDMTIVGPRPERPFYVDRFSQDVPRYSHRHRVPVGLTGLAQVSGLRGDTSIRDRARYDNYYIENWSLWLDIKVILRTVRQVLFARGG